MGEAIKQNNTDRFRDKSSRFLYKKIDEDIKGTSEEIYGTSEHKI